MSGVDDLDTWLKQYTKGLIILSKELHTSFLELFELSITDAAELMLQYINTTNELNKKLQTKTRRA
ncbi:MAG: hypothetical protein II929_05985 [Succinivibrio sp.]|nr:hypothetical protein [Succinivibrio sp.]